MQPSKQPTEQPSTQPSDHPTEQPTYQPQEPTEHPTELPTQQPTSSPTSCSAFGCSVPKNINVKLLADIELSDAKPSVCRITESISAWTTNLNVHRKETLVVRGSIVNSVVCRNIFKIQFYHIYCVYEIYQPYFQPNSQQPNLLNNHLNSRPNNQANIHLKNQQSNQACNHLNNQLVARHRVALSAVLYQKY